MGPLHISAGQRFGQLVAIERVASPDGHQRWRFKCDCGNETVAQVSHVNSGDTKSCGCLHKQHGFGMGKAHRNFKHGLRSASNAARAAEHRIWRRMIDRCYSPTNKYFKNCGGRGITICDHWRNSFDAFYADMGPRPSPELSLDRINNDGNYEPGNCRWATPSEQRQNRRSWEQMQRERPTRKDV